jgi:serine/threonine protein kinase
MFNPGDTIRLDSGRTIRLDREFDADLQGAQGAVYAATDLKSGQRRVFKALSSSTSESVARLRALLSLKLETACPVLVPPTDTFIRNGSVGSDAPYAPGDQWDHLRENYSLTLIEALQLATAVSQAVNLLHQRRIIHGDLAGKNLLVYRQGNVLRPSLIDFDNFKAPGVPEPPMVGQHYYMAPELWDAVVNRRPAIPDEYTELFALGVLNHEFLLVRHPTTGADGTPEEFQRALRAGYWLNDPARPDRVTGVGGLPVEVLNANLMRLFRRLPLHDRSARPTAAEWVGELRRALEQVFECPNPSCGCPCVIDASKTACPLGHPYPVLKLVGRFGQIVLRTASTALGRDNLGGSSRVSGKHATILRRGPEYWLESHGRNPTKRWANGGWYEFPKEQPRLIQKGDRLRFADVEAQVVEA